MPAQLPSDFTIRGVGDVKDAIEEINGITFRTPDTMIRTNYGVSVT